MKNSCATKEDDEERRGLGWMGPLSTASPHVRKSDSFSHFPVEDKEF